MKFSLKILEFKTEYKMNPKTRKRDRPVEWVLVANMAKHGRSETWLRVKELMPKEFDEDSSNGKSNDIHKFMVARWNHIEPYYENWKKGKSFEHDGTPLGSWPALSTDEVRALGSVGFHTVEAIAEIGENMISRVPLPHMRDMKKAAKEFLENSDKVALMSQLEEMQKELAALKAERQQEDVQEDVAVAQIPDDPDEKKPRKRKSA